MGQINLRTLAEKSTIGFGMFPNLTVRNLIDCNPHYLVWIYYHWSNINFHKSIIKELGLEIHIINKPGIDIDYFNKNAYLWGIKVPKRKHGIANWEVRSKRALQMENLW